MAYKTIELNNASVVSNQSQKTSHFYKGFSSINAANLGSSLYDLDLIKQDIINHFNTRKGERVMNPAFGSIVWDLLMEPLTDQVRDALTEDIDKICNFDPRVVPTRIDLTEYSNGYVLDLTLLLVGTDQSTNLKLTFDQQAGLGIQ